MTLLPYPKIGDKVKIVQKKDYTTGELTEGVVKDILTKKRNHPRGTKVRLESGVIGRIQEFSGSSVFGKKEVKNEIIYLDDEDALI